MNILNNKIEIKKITTIKVAKTNNTIISHLIDSGIDVDAINQSELKLQRLKLSQATRKHFSKSNEYMEIINAEIPIPNYVDFNLLLLDEDDWSKNDRKYMPLENEENIPILPHTWVHTVMSRPLQFKIYRLSRSNDLLWCQSQRRYHCCWI